MFPLEFRAEVNRQETRVMGLSSSEDRMIVAGVVLAWYRTVTDGRTVRQTESIMAKTALCIASYADALSKTFHRIKVDLNFDYWYKLIILISHEVGLMQRQKCRPMTLVSGNIRYLRILAGVPLGGDLKWQWGRWRRQFLAIWVVTSSETSERGRQYYMTICYPLLACDWLQNEWPRLTLSGYFT